MKNTKIIFLLAVIFCCPFFVSAQESKPPRTVEDFYMILPAKYIQPLAKTRNRKQIINVKDIPNGYLRIEANQFTKDWEGWAEVALFKKTNGGYLVGVVNGDCATICYSGVVFLEYQNGKWTDVTAKVLPKISEEKILARYKKLFPGDTEFNEEDPPYINYSLPRKGTILTLNSNTGGDGDTALFEFAWNGVKFELKN